ncbi:hypothetical protein yaldo0001_3060 [Yersinia aldovae ATCC 35236]|nr:hypothetical protein yaldo0001_3060 [Yersinia aldovae ATCC 35236]
MLAETGFVLILHITEFKYKNHANSEFFYRVYPRKYDLLSVFS